LSTRFSEVAEATEQSVTRGMVARLFSNFEESFFVFGKAPWFGYGLGIGTNAGAKFLTGHSMFILHEGEWPRVLLESGRLFGLAYLLWRCAFVGQTGWFCIKSVRRGNLLPLLLFGSSFLPMLNGQFGQPTILGFAVFATGLALAARNEEDSAITPSIVSRRAKPSQKIIRGRSAYADRLHGPPAIHGQGNGSANR
jgi:hypothetical protein